MLSRTFSTKYIKNKLSDTAVSIDIVRNTTFSFYPFNEKQYIGHFDEKFSGIYMKPTSFSSFGSSMSFTNNIMPSFFITFFYIGLGCLNQIRYSYTDTMPKVYKLATNVDKYKKDKDVPLSVQKNILGYTAFMFAGGTVLFMGKAFVNQVISYLEPDSLLMATSTLTVYLNLFQIKYFRLIFLKFLLEIMQNLYFVQDLLLLNIVLKKKLMK